MFTSLIYYKYENPDLDETFIGETFIGSMPCENEDSVKNMYFWNDHTVNGDRWKWNETKKRYELEAINNDFEDKDRYGKKFHAYGVIVEIPNIDISE